MNHDTVAHRWANGNYTHNGELKGPNVFAEESTRTIYSYGRHFPIARLTGNPAAPCLFTSAGYSSSTGKHKTIVWRACHHLRPLTCEDVTATHPHEHQHNLDVMAEAIRTAVDKHSRARENKAWIAEVIAKQLANAERYMGAFGVTRKSLDKRTLATFKLAKAGQWAELTEADKRACALADKARAKREAEARAAQIVRQAETKAKWLAGESVHYRTDHGPTLLRVRGGEVETSQGACVPVKHALTLFALVCRVRDNGQVWTSPPEKTHHVGRYTLTSIGADGTAIIGCHTLEFSEMVRIEADCIEALACKA